MDCSYQLMVYVFAGAARADEVYRALRSVDRRPDESKLGLVAVVRKSDLGVVSIAETRDLKFNVSLVGSLPLVGMLAGLVAAQTGIIRLSPVASVALGGAAGLAAGVVISMLNLGFPDETLQQIGAGLAVEQSAIVMLVRPSEEGYVRAKLTGCGGTLIQDTLPPETIAQLTAPRQTGPSKCQLAEASGADE